ncbi:hypothetical protein [Actinomadura kijaniata]|uniref:hypothetical protein n=1 Tax=Actinomadura kijaniata TaxID=46161 RepID=UPI003F53D160
MSASALEENGLGYDVSGHEAAAPVGVALVMAVLDHARAAQQGHQGLERVGGDQGLLSRASLVSGMRSRAPPDRGREDGLNRPEKGGHSARAAAGSCGVGPVPSRTGRGGAACAAGRS